MKQPHDAADLLRLVLLAMALGPLLFMAWDYWSYARNSRRTP